MNYQDGMATVICSFCGKEIKRTQSEINRNKTQHFYHKECLEEMYKKYRVSKRERKRFLQRKLSEMDDKK